jgi:hypothetical protein
MNLIIEHAKNLFSSQANGEIILMNVNNFRDVVLVSRNLLIKIIIKKI